MDPAFLPTVGNPLAMGSFFDAVPAGGIDRSAIGSHAVWRDVFGADPGAIGPGLRSLK